MHKVEKVTYTVRELEENFKKYNDYKNGLNNYNEKEQEEKEIEKN